MARCHSPRVKRSGFASSNQHRCVGIADQLVETLYFLESGDPGVCCFGGNWVEVWVGHDGGLKWGEEVVGPNL